MKYPIADGIMFLVLGFLSLKFVPKAEKARSPAGTPQAVPNSSASPTPAKAVESGRPAGLALKNTPSRLP